MEERRSETVAACDRYVGRVSSGDEQPVAYRHTQRAPAMLLISLAGFVFLGIAVITDDIEAGGWWLFVAMLFLVVVGVVAARLTVTVDDSSITAAFGWGWPRRRIAWTEVVDARRSRRSWWQGWGIRKIRNGWMYNNAGSDVIELSLRSGRVFNVGTDEPDVLLAAIDAALRRQR